MDVTTKERRKTCLNVANIAYNLISNLSIKKWKTQLDYKLQQYIGLPVLFLYI